MRAVLPSAPMAAPKNPRGGRPARSGAAASESVKLRLTPEEHERFARAALAAGFKMPITKADPEPRGAVGAWLRSLGLAAIGGSS